MEDASQRNIQAKARRRARLRAFAGALLAAPLGGLIGAGLGAFFAFLVFQGWESSISGLYTALYGAVFGIPPGLLAGAIMGAYMAVQDPDRRLQAGVNSGIWVGAIYSLPFWLFAQGVAVCIVISGIAGGSGLALLLRWVRARWTWWARWDEPVLQPATSVAPGSTPGTPAGSHLPPAAPAPAVDHSPVGADGPPAAPGPG